MNNLTEVTKVTCIITGLGNGGAENMLFKWLANVDPTRGVNFQVISLLDLGHYGARIQELGVPVYTMNIGRRNPITTFKQAKELCKDTDIISSWLYHADFFSLLIGKILLKKPLVWNIRNFNISMEANRLRTYLLIRVNALLSRFVDAITYNSTEAREAHESIAYSNKNAYVVPNGFDMKKFSFSLKGRQIIREKYGLTEDMTVLITVGRWDVQKDYYTLLRALENLKYRGVVFKLLMVGTNLDVGNRILLQILQERELQDIVILLGKREDIPELLSASDIYVSSSLGESFSNALGEALALGLPCVATNVGNAKELVNKYGVVVEPRNPRALENAIFNMIMSTEMTRELIGKQSRNSIATRYSISSVSDIYTNILCEVLNDCKINRDPHKAEQ